MSYPWYFQYKELASPNQSFERPAIRPRASRPEPIRDSITPAPAPPLARSRQRPPPSPSPSDRSSAASSSSPSPSPSLSPSPSPVTLPSPPHVASLMRLSLTPIPNLDGQRSSSASVVPSGPRPHVRPNAVASSSRIPVQVESSPSSSSASPASDIHLWGDPDSMRQVDIESEHEMENDIVERPSSEILTSIKVEGTLDVSPVSTRPQLSRPRVSKRAHALSPFEWQAGPNKRQRPHPASSRSSSDVSGSDDALDTHAETKTGGFDQQNSDFDREVEDDIDDSDSTSSTVSQRNEPNSGTSLPAEEAASDSCARCVAGPKSGALASHTCKFSQQCRRRLSLAALRVMRSPDSIEALSRELRRTSSQKLMKARSPHTRAVVMCRERSHLLCKTVKDMRKRK